MKYLVELESPDEEALANAKNALAMLPFVKNVDVVDNDDHSWDDYVSLKGDIDMYLELNKTTKL
jgi:hypothetical protein